MLSLYLPVVWISVDGNEDNAEMFFAKVSRPFLRWYNSQ
jgi:hypothetical protein